MTITLGQPTGKLCTSYASNAQSKTWKMSPAHQNPKIQRLHWVMFKLNSNVFTHQGCPSSFNLCPYSGTLVTQNTIEPQYQRAKVAQSDWAENTPMICCFVLWTLLSPYPTPRGNLENSVPSPTFKSTAITAKNWPVVWSDQVQGCFNKVLMKGCKCLCTCGF